MATDKQFLVVGISKRMGDYKVRFANDIMRIKVLAKGGHEDIRLAELDQPMDKMAAVKALAKMDEFQDVVAQATIAEYIERNTPKGKPESSPTATKAKVSKPVATATKTPAVKAAKTAKVTEDENAPF